MSVLFWLRMARAGVVGAVVGLYGSASGIRTSVVLITCVGIVILFGLCDWIREEERR